MAEFKLRPYQEECIETIEQAGEGHYLVHLATGLGKTVVFTHLKGMGRTMILSHRDELVRQPQRYYGPEVTFGVEKADEHADDGDEIVSASVQSMSRPARLQSYDKDAFETIIVDEAHHAAAPTYRQVLDHFSGAKRVLGFTATPKRGDNIGLSSIFDKIIFSRDIRWGINNGYLSRIRCIEVSANYSLKNLGTVNGDYSASQIESMFSDASADIYPVAAKTYIEKCHNEGRHTLIYCVSKDISRTLCDTITAMLPAREKNTVVTLFGDTPSDERHRILSDFSKGKVKCIINCMVLTEGTDLPICDAVINLRPTRNNTLYQQIAGRGTRLYEGKDFCLLIDIVPADGSDDKRTLCTAPTLFGIDPSRLDKKQKASLNDDADLLELCDSLSLLYASETARVELLSRDVDRFVEEFGSIIEAPGQKDAGDILKSYNELVSERTAQIPEELSEFDVEVFADDKRKYRIRPTWNSEIWVSEPDMLDNVTVTLPSMTTIGDAPARKADTIDWVGELPIAKAAKLIHAYCVLQPELYAPTWSIKAQREWEKTAATGSQKGKLANDLEGYGITVFGGRWMSKLAASKLIELGNRYKESSKLSAVFSDAKSGKKTKKAKQAKDKVDAMLRYKESSLKLTNKVIFNSLTHAILKEGAKRDKKLAQENAERKIQQDSVKRGGEFKVVVDRFVPSGRRASEKQTGYLESLNRRLKVYEAKEFKGLLAKMTMRQASVMISFLKLIQDFNKGDIKNIYLPNVTEKVMGSEQEEWAENGIKIIISQKNDG